MNKRVLERWMVGSDLPDAEDARRARLLDVLMLWFLASLALFSLVGLVIWLGRLTRTGGLLFLISLGSMALAGLIYAVNRSGRFQLAAWLLVVLLSLVTILLLLMFGHRGGAPMFIPVIIVFTAMLIGRGTEVFVALVLGAVYLVIALSEVSGRWNAWFLPYQDPFPAALLISGRVMGIILITALAWLSAGSLVQTMAAAQRNLIHSRERERELEQMRADLESQVAERTHDLESALAEVQQGMIEQNALLDTIHQQAIPVIPIFEQLVAVPVVGVLDAARADLLLTSLLDGIQRYDAQFALLDVTGAPVLEKEAAQALVQAVAGARLIGAECILVGINPDVAARLVDLGVDVSEFESRVDMEAGVRYALHRMRYRFAREPQA
ncbi:MAG: STAS domain-containing protein [Anaerolineae bacterium]|nr:STAS domain-containing protein [Anaerolineae bacterium]